MTRLLARIRSIHPYCRVVDVADRLAGCVFIVHSRRGLDGRQRDRRLVEVHREREELGELRSVEVVVADDDQGLASIGEPGPRVMPSMLSSGIFRSAKSSRSVLSAEGSASRSSSESNTGDIDTPCVRTM